MGRRLLALALAAGLLALGADRARAVWDRWIAATELPALTVPVGTEVLARDGTLLRAFPVGDGLWRLAPVRRRTHHAGRPGSGLPYRHPGGVSADAAVACLGGRTVAMAD